MPGLCWCPGCRARRRAGGSSTRAVGDMVTAGEFQGPGTVGDGLSTDELESAAIILGLVLLFMGTTDWYTEGMS